MTKDETQSRHVILFSGAGLNRTLIDNLLPESCTKYRSEAQKALYLKRNWSDFDPQAYYLYGEDQNHETSFKDKALQAAVDSWCKIQVLIRFFNFFHKFDFSICKHYYLTNPSDSRLKIRFDMKILRESFLKRYDQEDNLTNQTTPLWQISE